MADGVAELVGLAPAGVNSSAVTLKQGIEVAKTLASTKICLRC